jgi:hypothetical protein
MDTEMFVLKKKKILGIQYLQLLDWNWKMVHSYLQHEEDPGDTHTKDSGSKIESPGQVYTKQSIKYC